MDQPKEIESAKRRDENLEAARRARIRASKHTPEERKAAVERGMRMIYGDSAVKDSAGSGH